MLRFTRLAVPLWALLLASYAVAQPMNKASALPGAPVDPAVKSAGSAITRVILDTSLHKLVVHVNYKDFDTVPLSVKLHCCVAPNGPSVAATRALTDPQIGQTPDGIMTQEYDTLNPNLWSGSFLGVGAKDAETRFAAGFAKGEVYLVIYTVRNPELANNKGGEMRAFFP